MTPLEPGAEGILRYDGRSSRHGGRRSLAIKMLLTLLLLALAIAVRIGSASLARTPRPNIVFILTDDQDLHLNSLAYMHGVQTHLIQQGTTFNRHFATVSLCCPSRVSLLTGKAAHNTNVTDVGPPYGTYGLF